MSRKRENISAISHNSPSRKQLISQSQRDIETICRQVLRFLKMSPKEQISCFKQNPLDALCEIKLSNGKGNLICGPIAKERLYRLAERVIDFEPTLTHRISIESLKKIVSDEFAKSILEEGCEINASTTEQLLVDSANKAKQSLQITEHYLPCVLFHNGGPNEFEIGPVTFSRTAIFFRKHKQSIKKSVEHSINANIAHTNKLVEQGFSRERLATPAQSRQWIRNLKARAIRNYRCYPWVASVRIVNCDQSVSEERASQLVDIALNVIRIFLGADNTKRLRLACSKGDAQRTAHMWSGDDLLHVKVSSRGMGQVGFNNWHEALTEDGGRELLGVFGSALIQLADPMEPSGLHERFIDAINWFGDAAIDTRAATSLVKYTSAIERLYFGKRHDRHAKVFGRRVSDVLDAFGCGDKHTYDKSVVVYDARSKLLHGAISPRSEQVRKQAREAENIARMSVLCAARLYPMILLVYTDADPATLEKIMGRISSEGVNWLVQEANEAGRVKFDK